MGLSTTFWCTIRRTNKEEVLNVLSVITGDLYIEYNNFVLRNGMPTGIKISEEKEKDYKDGYLNGEKVNMVCSISYPLKGEFEHYFDNLKRLVEIMGMSSYTISSEFSEHSGIDTKEFLNKNIIEKYLEAYKSYFHRCTLIMFKENFSKKPLIEEEKFSNDKISKLLKEHLKTYNKKEYDICGIKMNMFLFIHWCYSNLGYQSLLEIKEKFSKKESDMYKKYIKETIEKEKLENPYEKALNFLCGVKHTYNYERGLGFLLKNIE